MVTHHGQLIASHCFSLLPTYSHCFSPLLTTSQLFSLRLTAYHCFSLLLTASHCFVLSIPLRTIRWHWEWWRKWNPVKEFLCLGV
jgi:hypothetical protein